MVTALIGRKQPHKQQIFERFSKCEVMNQKLKELINECVFIYVTYIQKIKSNLKKERERKGGSKIHIVNRQNDG